jgi:hypothetical protein
MPLYLAYPCKRDAFRTSGGKKNPARSKRPGQYCLRAAASPRQTRRGFKVQAPACAAAPAAWRSSPLSAALVLGAPLELVEIVPRFNVLKCLKVRRHDRRPGNSDICIPIGRAVASANCEARTQEACVSAYDAFHGKAATGRSSQLYRFGAGKRCVTSTCNGEESSVVRRGGVLNRFCQRRSKSCA